MKESSRGFERQRTPPDSKREHLFDPGGCRRSIATTPSGVGVRERPSTVGALSRPTATIFHPVGIFVVINQPFALNQLGSVNRFVRAAKIDPQPASKPTHFLRTSMMYFNKSLNSRRFFICRIRFSGINDTSDSITSSTSYCEIVMGSG